MRLIGVLMGSANDQNVREYIAAFRAGLNAHGGTEALNLRIDYSTLHSAIAFNQNACEALPND
jgi:hypothetical protein